MWPGCHQPQPPAPRKPGRGRPRPADSGGSSSLLPLPRAFLPSLLVLALEMGRGGTRGPDLPVKGTRRLSVKRGKSLAQPSESAALGRGWVPQPSGGTPKPRSLGPTPPQLQMPSRQVLPQSRPGHQDAGLCLPHPTRSLTRRFRRARHTPGTEGAAGAERRDRVLHSGLAQGLGTPREGSSNAPRCTPHGCDGLGELVKRGAGKAVWAEAPRGPGAWRSAVSLSSFPAGAR